MRKNLTFKEKSAVFLLTKKIFFVKNFLVFSFYLIFSPFHKALRYGRYFELIEFFFTT